MNATKVPTILEDKREILTIEYEDTNREWHVGLDNIRRIVAYPEPGEGAYVPWLAVYQDDGWGHDETIRARVPAGQVTITYKWGTQ